MFNTLVAIFLILHGLIHLIGFVVPWQLVKTDEFPYSTTILAKRIDVVLLGYLLFGGKISWLPKL